jgi:hypothetical protein
MRAFVIAAPRKSSEAFLVEDLGDARGAERRHVLIEFEGVADVVDGQILLAQLDDGVAELVTLRALPVLFAGFGEELALGVLPELGAEHAETPGCVTESSGGLLGG